MRTSINESVFNMFGKMTSAFLSLDTDCFQAKNHCIRCHSVPLLFILLTCLQNCHFGLSMFQLSDLRQLKTIWLGPNDKSIIHASMVSRLSQCASISRQELEVPQLGKQKQCILKVIAGCKYVELSAGV